MNKLRRAGIGAISIATLLLFNSHAAAGPTTNPTTAPSAVDDGDGHAHHLKGIDADLTSMSIDELMNVVVTTVSRQKQKISEVAAAVTVINQDDIQRSGLHSVPELLRLVPGMDVAQFNANTWAIGSRGFNDVFDNKLLVLSDGRSVYSPLFSGVFWDMQQPMLQDLDRIEVIRGPGATIWGSNAVNGVINITSKSSRDTQGVLATGLGSNYQQEGAVRFGGQIDDKTFFRIYSKYQNTNDFPLTSGGGGFDGWQNVTTGFRLDRYATDTDTFTLQGDYTSVREGQILQLASFAPPFITPTQELQDDIGFNVLGRWTHTISAKSDVEVQAYFDQISRTSQLTPYKLDTADIESHYRLPIGDRQELITGMEYRFYADRVNPSSLIITDPHRSDDYIASAFVQDDLEVVPDRLHFIAGTKLEQNSTSGFEVQPSGRAVWTPNDKNAVWAAVSRAVRTPSRWEQTAAIPSTPIAAPGVPFPIQPVAEGNATFESEQLVAYELGYRVQPTKKFSIDTAASYNAYDQLRSFNTGIPQFVPVPAPHFIQPAPAGNSLYGETLGLEIAGNWQVLERWRLSASYSFLDTQFHQRNPSTPANSNQEALLEHGSPRNQAQLHSYLDVAKNLQLNASLYYVDSLPALVVPAYIRTDLGLVWTPKKNLELSVGVQNLFDSRHPEFVNGNTTFSTPTEIPRTIYAQLVFRY